MTDQRHPLNAAEEAPRSGRSFDTATGPDANGQWVTISGEVITDATIAALVADAEAGFRHARFADGSQRTIRDVIGQ